MTLDMGEIEVTTARDSEADVSRIASQLKVEMLGDPRLDAEQDAWAERNIMRLNSLSFGGLRHTRRRQHSFPLSDKKMKLAEDLNTDII